MDDAERDRPPRDPEGFIAVIKLLIVDDETRFLKTIAQRLRLRGLTVSTASSGPEAIAICQQEQFDVALLDLKMPGMDGSRVLKALREIDPLLETIMLTGHGLLHGNLDLGDLGPFGCLPKPYELDRLLDKLADAYAARLRRQHATAPARLARITELATGPALVRMAQLKAFAAAVEGEEQ